MALLRPDQQKRLWNPAFAGMSGIETAFEVKSLATNAVTHYIALAGLRGATESIARGLTILKGAVPGRTPGSGHMAPTYLCRFPGSYPTAFAAPHFQLIYIVVRAGLVPAIHVFTVRVAKSWMPGTRLVLGPRVGADPCAGHDGECFDPSECHSNR